MPARRFIWTLVLIVSAALLVAFSASLSMAQPPPRKKSKIDAEATEKIEKMSPEEVDKLDRLLAKALTLYYDRQFAKALPIFKQLSSKVETMDIMFWLGTSALEMGDLNLAEKKFLLMLAEDPTLNRVRLELARAYFLLERYEECRQQLQIVLAAKPPDMVVKNINSMLRAVDERTQRVRWSARVSLSAEYDNNINAGPESETFLVSGGQLTIAPQNRRISDTAFTESFNGNILADPFGERFFYLNTSASFYHRWYVSESLYEFVSGEVLGGPWFMGRKYVVKLHGIYKKFWYQHDRLSHVWAVNPSFEYYPTQYLSLGGRYEYSEERYDLDMYRMQDNQIHSYKGTASVYLFNRKHLFTVGYGEEHKNAKIDRFSYRGPIYEVSYFAQLHKGNNLLTGTELFLRYSFADRYYQARPLIAAIFPQRNLNQGREDERHTYLATLSQNIGKYYFLSLSYSYTDNRSNTPVFEFEREIFSLSAGLKF